MVLTLVLLQGTDTAGQSLYRVGGDQCSIGRDPGCDLVLPDEGRILSKRHCLLQRGREGWRVEDLSTNGTFLNRANQPIGTGRSAMLAHGDHLRLGRCEIELRIQGVTPPTETGTLGPSALPFASAGDAPSDDSLLAGFTGARSPSGARLPDALDSFTTDPQWQDHRPATSDAYRPPAALPVAKLPDDWDWQAEALVSPAAATPDDWHAPPEQAGEPLPAEPSFPAPAMAEDAPAGRPVQPEAPAMLLPPPAADVAQACALLLAAAGLPPTALAGQDPPRVLQAAGAVLQACIGGLRNMLTGRAEAKREYRIEATVLRRAGNNGLKFAATDEAALAALLAGEDLQELQDILRDLAAHQLATVLATQAAARALLERLAPAALEAMQPPARFLLPGGRERQLWQAYRARHAQLAEQFDDDFDSVFGQAFARAYEQATKKE
jgi:type VI secretion system protein ImpI/type VI secretion system protein